MPLQSVRFGPFLKGVIDRANPTADLTGALQSAKGVTLQGAGKLSLRPGTTTALTLYDDQGSPAHVTSVCHVGPFYDGALAIAHSTTTQKAYLYKLKADFTGWYNSAGVLQSNTSPQPTAVLWTGMATSPDVSVAEGLGVAYIAHTVALDSSTLAWPTKTYTDSTRVVATLTADLDSSGGAEDLYFTGVVAFQQHLWAWGFGSGTTATTGYRPELARFSAPSFGGFSGSDSITLGDRVRSDREKIVGAGVAGDALYLGAPFQLTRVTGYGRNSWYKQPVDKSYGFVGPKCMVTVGPVLYYWSSKGPMRIGPSGQPDPLWGPITDAIEHAINAQQVIAGYDETTETVVFAYDTGAGVRTWCGYQVRLDAWLGPDDDLGLVMKCAGSVSPVYSTAVTGVSGPSGAPTSASTTSVGATVATANWTAGDTAAVTQVEYRRQVDTTWTVATTSLAAGVTAYTITGLTSGVAYEWRAAHYKNGQFSSYLGPVAGSQFTTATTLNAPTNLSLTDYGSDGTTATIRVAWTNSGETGASTEVYRAGPSVGAPAAGLYVLDQTVSPGVSSTTTGVTVDGKYWIKIRHTQSGITASAYAGPSSIIENI